MHLPIEHTEHFISTNGVTLHVVTAGPENGTPVILLHGFPEFWYGWRHQIPALAAQGLRVIVPDQRGYNLSDKLKYVGDYRLSALAADITGLMDYFGYDQAHLVGHDWGGVVAWWVATLYPARLNKLVIMNAPYPTLLFDEARKLNLSQMLKSWYIVSFQMPLLPEFMLSMNHYQPLAEAMQRSAQPATFSRDDLMDYRRAWAVPGALTGMLNWYRAAVQIRSKDDAHPDRLKPLITAPTLLLWGEQDVALNAELAQASVDLCAQGQLIYFPEASHFVQHDEKEAVNTHLQTFLTS